MKSNSPTLRQPTAWMGVNGTARLHGGLFRPWLHAYAVLTAVIVLVLIGSGGIVTSKEAGLTVPDWPNSYGYNMFAFPISRWVGGVFYEHTHRLVASGVGLLTLGLTTSVLIWERRRWVRWLGVAATPAVVCQGLLGGLRVVWLKDEIGIFHACLAQAFFGLVCLIALVTSAWWLKPRIAPPSAAATLRRLRNVTVLATVAIYVQLALGATMRHAHAGLAIPDFPTAYGAWLPPTDPAAVEAINVQRDAHGLPPTSAVQIVLQMVHRGGALVATVLVVTAGLLAWLGWRDLQSGVRRLALAWPALVVVQVTLGIYTILTNKAADVATMHVVTGALLLVSGVVLSAFFINDARASEFARRAVDEVEEPVMAAREVALV